MYGAHEAKLYYVTETVYGTTPATPAMFGMNDNLESVEPAIDPGLIKMRGFGSRDLTDIKPGLRKINLKVIYFLPSEDVIQFLQHINTLYPQTVEVWYEKDASIVDLRHTGCIFDKAVVSCSMEDAIKAEIDLIGQDLAAEESKIAGATYTDYAGLIPFSDSYVKKGDADGTNLTVLEEITDWKWTIANNLKRVGVIRVTDGNLLKYLRERHRNLMGELTFEFENRTAFYEVINDTEFSIQLGLGATNDILFKYCKWDNVIAPTRIEDLVSLRAPFTARDVTLT